MAITSCPKTFDMLSISQHLRHACARYFVPKPVNHKDVGLEGVPDASPWALYANGFNKKLKPTPAMEPTTAPEDYRLFDGASSIEFYTDPALIPGVLVTSPKSDWGALSQASSVGEREAMERVTSHLRYHEGPYYGGLFGEPTGIPDITLEFTYAGTSAARLLEECARESERYCEPRVYLWRFRITSQEGDVAECCFRAYMFDLSRRRSGKIIGVLGVIDSQPLIAKVEPHLSHAAKPARH